MPRPLKDIKVKLDSKSGLYLVSFLETPGRHFQTPETDSRKATEWAKRNKATLLADPEKPLLIKDLAPRFFDENGAWYQDKLKKGNPMTVASLKIRQGHIVNYIIPLFGEWDIRKIRGVDIDQGILNVKGIFKGVPELSRGTRAKLLYSIKLMFDRWVYDGLLTENPTNGIIKYAKAPENPRSSLPAEVCEELFPNSHAGLIRIWGKTVYAVTMLCLFDTGARPGELRAKLWSGYYPEERFMPYRKSIESGTKDKEKDTKGGQISPAYVSKRTAQELEIWRAESHFNNDDDYIFTTDGKVPISIATIENVFKRALEFLGYNSRGWTPYWLRHTFVSYAAEALDDSEMLMAVGHTNLGMNNNYRHLEDETVLKRSKSIREKLDAMREDKTKK